MTSKGLEILNVLEADEWEEAKHLPRAVLPQDFSREPCVRCLAPCCASIVRLTTVETLRIAFTLVIDLESFVEPIALEPGQSEINAHPIVLDNGRAFIRLQHRQGGCVGAFLPAPGRVRCGMHALRPGACRVYPHTVIVDEEHQYSVGSQKLCEVKWLQDDSFRAALLKDIRQWREDFDMDDEITERWNHETRTDRRWQTFCAWLRDEVAPTLGHEPERLLPLPKRSLGKKLW